MCCLCRSWLCINILLSDSFTPPTSGLYLEIVFNYFWRHISFRVPWFSDASVVSVFWENRTVINILCVFGESQVPAAFLFHLPIDFSCQNPYLDVFLCYVTVRDLSIQDLKTPGYWGCLCYYRRMEWNSVGLELGGFVREDNHTSQKYPGQWFHLCFLISLSLNMRTYRA
jgi:hypothetical protein